MLPDIPTLLTIRAILASFLVFILLTGTIALFLSKQNGLTRALAYLALTETLYKGVVVFISLVDTAAAPLIRQRMLAAWDVIHLFVLAAWFWLGYRMLKERHDEHG